VFLVYLLLNFFNTQSNRNVIPLNHNKFCLFEDNITLNSITSTNQLIAHVTISMKHSAREAADASSSSQEIFRVLWNTEAHYTGHKCQPLVNFLKCPKVRPALSSNNFKIHSNIILISFPVSSTRSLSSIIPHQKPLSISFLPPHVPHAPSFNST
jgi:hypothetical protein